MNIDIAQLLRDALTEYGCERHKLGDFDGHSTIVLEFKDHPDLLVSNINDDIWLWTALAEYHPQIVRQHSAALLEKLMQGCLFSVTGQLQMQNHENMLELRGLVHPDYLQTPQRFAEALNEFFVLSAEYSGLWR